MDGLRRTETLEFSLLQNAQQLWLQLEWHFTDLVQEHGAAVGQFEAADTLGNRPSESAALVTEHLAFKKPRGNRGAVELHERSRVTKAEIMDRACDQFFSRPRLAMDKHGRIGGRYGPHVFQYLSQRRTLT